MQQASSVLESTLSIYDDIEQLLTGDTVFLHVSVSVEGRSADETHRQWSVRFSGHGMIISATGQPTKLHRRCSNAVAERLSPCHKKKAHTHHYMEPKGPTIPISHSPCCRGGENSFCTPGTVCRLYRERLGREQG